MPRDQHEKEQPQRDLAALDTETLPLFPDGSSGEAFGPAARFGETLEGIDLPRLATATVRVAAVLADGCWHSIDDLRETGGSSGDRRARDLRDRRWGCLPVEVEPCPMAGRGHWRYRINRDRLSQQQGVVLESLVVLAMQEGR